ncbi:hypothetical protein [Kitasatospora sp. NPDC090091]|uniref:hypothetical protein n=1 Tax=Kitasatospora sp. NPDC090091 TaxID=3364081 RepID=UPI0038205430
MLLNHTPPETAVSAWYRDLYGRLPAAVRSALLRATGADRPVHELATMAGTARAALGAAVLYRSSQDVVDLLVALAGRRPGPPPPPPPDRSECLLQQTELTGESQRTELRRIIAATRPYAELVVILRGLIQRGGSEEADRIVCHIVSDEPVARVVELLEAPAGEDMPRAAALLADAALVQGTTADLIGRLLEARERGSAKVLVDGLVSLMRGGAPMAQLAVSLFEAGATPAILDRLIEPYCRCQRPEEVANFLHHLSRLGLHVYLGRAITATTSARRNDLAEIRRTLEKLGSEELSASLAGSSMTLGRPGPGTVWERPFWQRNRPR